MILAIVAILLEMQETVDCTDTVQVIFRSSATKAVAQVVKRS